MKVLHVRAGLVKGTFGVWSCSVVSVEASVRGAFLKGYSKACLVSGRLATARSTAVKLSWTRRRHRHSVNFTELNLVSDFQ